MNRQEIIELINSNPVFFLATVDSDRPRVRGMLYSGPCEWRTRDS